MVKDYLSTFPCKKFVGKFKVVRLINQWTYELEDMITGARIQRHYNQIKAVNKSKSKPKTPSSISSLSHQATIVRKSLPQPEKQKPLRRTTRKIMKPERFF